VTGSLRVLVAGANSMFAHDLVPALRAAGHLVTSLNRADLDVTDPAECVAAVAGHDMVVNTAAWTAVDDAEAMEAEAFAVNALGAANLARAAQHADARLVHLSTDYIFEGQATEPYAADALPGPRSAYGRTKLAGEWAIRAIHTDYWIIRTAWLYGEGGPNFVDTMCRLAGDRETVTIVDDQHGQPTWTRDLADLVVRMIAGRAPVGTYHGTSTGQTSWHGLARAVFEDLGLDPGRVVATTTGSYLRPAPRPAYSVLSHATLEAAHVAPIRDWRAGLTAYLASV
jgi:dTDP-4-dehydrorhamnose reductase